MDRLPTKKVSDIVYCLKAQFARHGIPDVLFSDNSPFLSQEFANFATAYEFRHETSSPRYPQSNGKAENAVKTAKRLMTKALASNADPFLALLDWRNTPSETLNQSPAQILFGRRTRTKLPSAQTLLSTPLTDQTKQLLAKAKEKQAKYYDRGTKPRPELKVGVTVRFLPEGEGEWRKGEIQKVLPHRSYKILQEDGTTRRRTSRHVRFSREPPVTRYFDPEPISDNLSTYRSPMTSSSPNRSPAAAPNDNPRSLTASSSSSLSSPSSSSHGDAPVMITRRGRKIYRPRRYRE